MKPIVRVLAGIAVGLGYSLLVGGVIFLIDFISGDSNHSSGLLIDPKAIFRALLFLAMTVTGSAGAVVGLIVTVLRTGKTKAALIGFCTGLLVLAGIVVKVWPQLEWPANDSGFALGVLFLVFLFLIIVLPAGLAATGVTASVVAARVTK
jgi:hypothetical protein